MNFQICLAIRTKNIFSLHLLLLEFGYVSPYVQSCSLGFIGLLGLVAFPIISIPRFQICYPLLSGLYSLWIVSEPVGMVGKVTGK